ncbi:hypothetical protein QLH51_03640 [Sphingomonas sp. 2R-10]|uniref:hypothetical protein n=1 Tax=Sphingomonas sp. 2R-10 TaxID=3045148 RepID=UPI000F77CAE9|nr:hypothetical protein [Sphingomonas sp. 2R-10]MDJ0275894.1 hypothetical protein [Sphingomonas sp. 2R-10]
MTVLVGAAMSLSATAHAERAHRIEAPYDPAAHEIRDGDNVIQGNALIPLSDGDAVTCRGQSVFLVPVTPYTTERMMVAFDSDRQGFRDVRIKRGLHIAGFGKSTREPFPPFEPRNDHYQQSAGRDTRCDSRGDFQFSGVADGDYFVTTVITWQHYGRIPDGGSLMRRVSLRGGRTTRVVLAP